MTVQRPWNTPWCGNRCYVDLLYPGVTEKFLEVTHEAYRRAVGDQFGKRIPGSFTDEPSLHPAPNGALPWTDGLPAEFQKRWGYSLVENLASMFRPVGDWKRVRHNFFQVVLEQFIEHWSKPYHDYCQKYGLEWTGHYFDHEWPNCALGPDNMAMYAWHQRPAIDCLMNQYHEDTHAQFGNLRMVKELGSVANQLGMSRTLCESYGVGGWDLRFEDMKRIGDWLFVLGVNSLTECQSFISMRGARKHDHPQSFSYHEPWWDAYHVMAEYFTRLSLAISSGEQRNSILVLEPTTTAWMYQMVVWRGDKQDYVTEPSRLKELGDQFFQLVLGLSKAQVEYDIGSEDIIARNGSVDGRQFVIGRQKYTTVVLPPFIESLNAKTIGLLEKYAQAGGRVLCCGDPPALVDGRPSDRAKTAAASSGWRWMEPPTVISTLAKAAPDGFRVEQDSSRQRPSLSSAPSPLRRGTGLPGQHQSRRGGLRLGDFTAGRFRAMEPGDGGNRALPGRSWEARHEDSFYASTVREPTVTAREDSVSVDGACGWAR